MKHSLLWKATTTLFLALTTAFCASAQDYFGRLAMEGVELRTAVKWGMQDFLTREIMQSGLYQLEFDRQFQPQKDKPLKCFQPDGGMTRSADRIYVMAFDDTGRVHAQKPKWQTYDAHSLELLSEIELGDNCTATTNNIAYDWSTGKVYGFLSTYTENFFVEITPETGEVKRIAQLTWDNKYTAIACDKQGQLYAIYFNKESSVHYLARIRKSDGRMANVGVISATNLLPGDMFTDGGYNQAIFFNNATDQLYWTFLSASENSTNSEYAYMPLFEVNTKTAVATMRAYSFEDIIFTGAYFDEPAWTAPAIITDFAYEATSDNLMSGNVQFTLPSTDYIGHTLEGTLTVKGYEGEDLAFSLTGAPGERISVPKAWTCGNHTLRIAVSNAAGEEGPTVKRTFFAGFDRPDVCQNIRLTADGLTAHLTWEPPTKGVNGAPIRSDKYTYTVIRYPYEVTVADGLTECSFSEEHPADMTRYVYLVRANDPDAGAGKWAFSNNYIIGTPLDVPYGGYFRSAADLMNYYTIIDNNNDNATWGYDTNTASAFYQFSTTNNADDYLVSPPINYKKGKTYELKFNAYSHNAQYPESLEVLFGKGRQPKDQKQLLLYIDEVPGVSEDSPVQEYSTRFTVDTDSVYHYSFHAISPAFSFYLYVFNIRVDEVKEAGINDVVAPSSPVVSRRFFLPTGVETTHPRKGELVIERTTFADGTSRTTKHIIP